jgi:hypothetical protein
MKLPNIPGVNLGGIISAMAVIYLGGLGVLLVSQTVPTGNKEMLIYILGTLSGVATATVVSRTPGSSNTTATGDINLANPPGPPPPLPPGEQ